MTATGPVKQSERISELDSLRGAALFGVLVVNMLQGYSFITTDADQLVATIIRVLGEGSFYPMFSFLFGLGFALQLRKGEAVLPLFRKRLGILLAIGLVHALLIWAGDILVNYALVGFLLPQFRHMSGQKIIRISLLLWGVTLFLFLFSAAVFIPTDSPASYLRPAGETYLSVLADRVPYMLGNLIPELLAFGPQLLALFLLGFLTGRTGPQQVLNNQRLLRRVFWLCLLIALPFLVWFSGTSLVQAVPLPGNAAWLYVLEYLIASPLLGFAYLAGLALLLHWDLWQRLLSPFRATGQMALSNYLGQSLICTTLFYPYGFDLFGTLGAATTFNISLVIFAGQAVLSLVWLHYFRFGPAEWLWRNLTYGSWQTLP